MHIRILSILLCLFFLSNCLHPNRLSVKDIKELALIHFQDKQYKAVKDTSDIGVKLISAGINDEWYVAFNKVMSQPALFLYHISKPYDAPHYIPLHNKSDGIIEHVDFENITNDEIYELVIELHYDYGLAYQGREIIILRNPFGNPAYEIFAFPFEQIWESIDSFDQEYGLPKHSKRIENHSYYEFFEGYILLRGTINYRDNHLLEYKWDKYNEEFVLILDEELHEIDEEENKGGIVHKVKGNKILVEVNAHEEGCVAYLIEDVNGHVIDVSKKIHDKLLCSRTTSLAPNGRFLIYTDYEKNAICLYDFITKKTQTILNNHNSYEGISEVVWAPGRPMRFAFIAVNQEEFLENTRLFVYTFDKDLEIHKRSYKKSIFYECDLEGICVPHKDYNYKFHSNKRFVYTPDSTGRFLSLTLK